MQLFHFLLVIISLSCGSLPPIEQAIGTPLVATIVLAFVWSALCLYGARVIARQVTLDKLGHTEGADWLEKQLEIFRWLSLAVVVMCLAGFGLGRCLDQTPILKDSMFLQAIVLLLPGLIMTIGNWAAEQYYGACLNYTQGGLIQQCKNVWYMFRGGIGWIIAPVMMMLGFSDLLNLLPVPDTTKSCVMSVAVLVFLVFLLPIMLRRLFKTEAMAPEDEIWMGNLLQAVGVRGTKPVVWNTQLQSFNAMVAGFVPGFRTLLVTDRLLRELPREQVAMVVLHEAAHLKRRHVPIRLLSLLPAWGAGALVTRMAGDSTWAMTLGTAAALLLTLLILRIVAFRSEYDADAIACRMAASISGSVKDLPANYADATDALCSALLRVTAGHPTAQKATWLHPGVSDRVSAMRSHLSQPIASTTTAGTIANPA